MNEVAEAAAKAGPSLLYRVGKGIVATAVSLVATVLAEKAFDKSAAAIKNHQFEVPPIEES